MRSILDKRSAIVKLFKAGNSRRISAESEQNAGVEDFKTF